MKLIMEDPITGHRMSTYIDPLKVTPYREEIPSDEGNLLSLFPNRHEQQEQEQQQQAVAGVGSEGDGGGSPGTGAGVGVVGTGAATTTTSEHNDSNTTTTVWSQLFVADDYDDNDDNGNGNSNSYDTGTNIVRKYRTSFSNMISTTHHQTLRNFWWMSILFGLNQACVNVCLSLSTIPQLNSSSTFIGIRQNLIVLIFHTIISLIGATYIVKHYGSRNTMWIGMILNALYVTSFVIIITSTSSSTSIPSADLSSSSYVETLSMTAIEQEIVAGPRTATTATTPNIASSSSSTFLSFIAYAGAALGGLGAGLGWTGQGSYFTQASLEHSQRVQQPLSASTTSLGAIFAYFLVMEELLIRLLSSILRASDVIETSRGIAIVFTVLIWISVSLMGCLDNYITTVQEEILQRRFGRREQTTYEQLTATIQLFRNDIKIRYLIPISCLSGMSFAFINVYVNGKFVERALDDPYMVDTFELSAWSCLVAALSCLFFGRMTRYVGKKFILQLCVLCFFFTVFPFLIIPNPKNGHWDWTWLVIIFSFLGLGRASYEGTLRATYADFFPYEKEGAFASMTLIHGLSNAIGYILSTSIPCLEKEKLRMYCVVYHHHYYHHTTSSTTDDDDDDMYDDDIADERSTTARSILVFELIFILFTFLSIRGYAKAATLHHQQVAINRLALSDGNDMS